MNESFKQKLRTEVIIYNEIISEYKPLFIDKIEKCRKRVSDVLCRWERSFAKPPEAHLQVNMWQTRCNVALKETTQLRNEPVSSAEIWVQFSIPYLA